MTNDEYDEVYLNYSRGCISYAELVAIIKGRISLTQTLSERMGERLGQNG